MSIIIKEEDPYVAVADDEHLNSVCSACFKEAQEVALSRCVRCKILHYCGADCQKLDWRIHKTECKFMQASEELPSTDVRLMGRLLIRARKGDASSVRGFNGRTFNDLTDNFANQKDHLAWVTFTDTILKPLKKYVSYDYLLSHSEMFCYFGRLDTNRIEITSCHTYQNIGCSLYLGLSVMGHSCTPDGYFYSRGATLVLKSPIEGIKYSDNLTVSFCVSILTKKKRAEFLKRFSIECACTKCLDKKLEGFALSIRCNACVDGICPLIEDEPELICAKCKAKSGHSPSEAERMNREAEDTTCRFMAKEIDISKCIAQYDHLSRYLSKRNIHLARMAEGIAKALAIVGSVTCASYALCFHEALIAYLPRGCLDITFTLLTAAEAATFARLPEAPELVKLLREALLNSHGSLAAAHAENDIRALDLYGFLGKYEQRLLE